MIVNMCRAFGCLPSQLLEEDAQLLRLLNIVELGAPDQQHEGTADDGQ